MAKQQSLQRIRMYDPSTYRSVEQRVGDALKPLGKEIISIGNGMIQSFYGTFAFPFRVPTVIRRVRNNQTLWDKEPDDESFKFGGKIGMGLGLFSYIGLGAYSIIEAKNGNYTLPLICASTNLASSLFEIGRRERNRLEFLGVQKFRDWKRKKEEEKVEEEKAKEK